MSVLLVTPCTNRKLGSARHNALGAQQLAAGTQHQLCKQWVGLIKAAVPVATADQLYGGRGFKEALSTVGLQRDRLWIISAGLGLIAATHAVPAYNLTVVPGSEQCIQGRLIGETFDPARWWETLNVQLNRGFGLASLVRAHPRSTVVVTLSSAYADLVAADLLQLSPDERQRIRVVGLVTADALPETLRPNWMPYDLRFDGPNSPLRGTRADFAQRAARHFVEVICAEGSRADAGAHAKAVQMALRDLVPPTIPERISADDSYIQSIILRRWDDAGGRSSQMLRILRDDEGVRCEQGRFARLFRSVKDMRI